MTIGSTRGASESYELRLIRSMVAGMRDHVLPGLNSAGAVDVAESVLRSLALMGAERALGEPDVARYAETVGLTNRVEGTPQARLDVLRASAADGVAAGTISPIRAMAAERDVQRVIVEARDERSGAANSVTGSDQVDGASDIARRLERYLHQRWPQEQALIVTGARVIPGGRSKQTLWVTVAGQVNVPAEFILRLDRPVPLIPTRAAEEFRIIKAVWDHGGIPVPEPILGEDEESWLGGTFLLCGVVEGNKAGEYFPEVASPAEHREEIGRDLARLMGRLHALDPASLGLAQSTAGVQRWSAELDEIHAGMRAIGARVPEYEVARAWLLDHLGAADGPATVQHGDIGLQNLLVKDGRITALVDWELVTAGPAAVDIANCRHAIEVLIPWDEFVAEYRFAGGPEAALVPDHLAFHTLLRAARAVMTSHAAGAMFASGQSDDLVLGNAGYDFALRTRQLLVSALERVTTVAP